VIGFPLGHETTAVKVFQAGAAIRDGARELDMVIPLGAARAGDYAEVAAEVRAVVEAAAGVPVKVIIECCLFDAAGQRQLVEAAVRRRGDGGGCPQPGGGRCRADRGESFGRDP
jgi:deoxyribose-phosphate aldolase